MKIKTKDLTGAALDWAVPLTDEQIAEGFAKRSRHIGLFAGGVRFAERHHGIKGGQHG